MKAEDIREAGHYRSYDGIEWEKLPDPSPRGTWFKHLLRFMLNPGRLVMGLPTAYVVAWLCNHHTVTDNVFWVFYASWLAGVFTYFCLMSVYAWAGGKPTLKQ